MKFLLPFFILFGVFSFAHAADNPCKKDQELYCKDVVRGGNRLVQCLSNNEVKLTAECKKFRDEIKPRIAGVKLACQDDYQAYCSDKKPRDGEIRRCFAQNFKTLTMGCRNEIRNQKRLNRIQKNKNTKAKDAKNDE